MTIRLSDISYSQAVTEQVSPREVPVGTRAPSRPAVQSLRRYTNGLAMTEVRAGREDLPTRLGELVQVVT